MRRRGVAYQQQLERANKVVASVESDKRGVCPTCGAALAGIAPSPSEGIHGDSRRNSLKNPRGPRSRV
jgi:hypothetical protein